MFKKQKPDFIKLPEPDGSLSFFETIKIESEKYWVDSSPNGGIYGFQIQKDSKWRPGLTDSEIKEFETALEIIFPQTLKNFYKTMNGLTKPGINLYANDGTTPAFMPVFYSFPEDISLIERLINWIYEANGVKKGYHESLGFSRIFPVFHHRCMLIDIPANPILSMYGDDVIYWSDNLSKLLANEIFSNINNVWDFENVPGNEPGIKFWLD